MGTRIRSAAWLLAGIVVGSALTYSVRPRHRPTPWVGEAEAGLDRIVERVEAVDRPLAEVLDDVARSSGANISVRWAALNEDGFEKSTPVRLRLEGVPLGRVLEELLRQMSPSYPLLRFRADRGAVVISTAKDLNRDSVIRMYDVRDLLDIMTRDALAQNTSAPASETGRGSVLQGNFSNWPRSGAEEARVEAVEQLIMMIQESVSPDHWREAGGALARFAPCLMSWSSPTRPRHTLTCRSYSTNCGDGWWRRAIDAVPPDIGRCCGAIAPRRRRDRPVAS